MRNDDDGDMDVTSHKLQDVGLLSILIPMQNTRESILSLFQAKELSTIIGVAIF